MSSQLDKSGDARISAAFAEAGLDEAILADRARLEALVRDSVKPALAARYGELGEAAFEIETDEEHSSFRVRTPRGRAGVKRETVIDVDVIQSPEFQSLRKVGKELSQRLSLPCPGHRRRRRAGAGRHLRGPVARRSRTRAARASRSSATRASAR